MWIRLIVLFGVSLIIGCGREDAAAPADTGEPDKTVADTIYSGGPILTMNDAQPTVEAVAVKDGRVLAVGALDDLIALEGAGTERFDLEGRINSGFFDVENQPVRLSEFMIFERALATSGWFGG